MATLLSCDLQGSWQVIPPTHARVVSVHNSAVALEPRPHRRQMGDAHFHIFIRNGRAAVSLRRGFGRGRAVGRGVARGAAGCRRAHTASGRPNLIC